MNVNFYLDRKHPDRKGYVRIFLYARWEGKTLKVYTQEKTLSEYWNTKLSRPKEKTSGAVELTDLLDSWEEEIKKVNRQARTERKAVTVEFFKKNLSFTRKHGGTFFDIWDEYAQKQSKKVKPGTLKAYNTTWKSLKVIDGSHPGLSDTEYRKYNSMSRERDFINEYRSYKIEFGSINEDFVDRLIDYTSFMEYNNEFCNQLLTRVKAFMNWAVKKRYLRDLDFRELETELKKRDDDANIYFLLADELAHLTHMKIDNERLDQVRDVFCFGCYTGLRYSDIEYFRKDSINEDQYTLTQVKTGKSISNPLFDPAKKILEKYEHLPGDYALPKYSNQKMNDYLKELGKLAGFNRKIALYNNIGPESTRQSFPLYSLMSTHTARKTFITYLINSGMDKNMVRTWTGQSEAVIKRYFKILDDYKKKQAAILNKKFKKDAANGRKLRKA